MQWWSWGSFTVLSSAMIHVRFGAASLSFYCIFSICSNWMSTGWPEFSPFQFVVPSRLSQPNHIKTPELSFQVSNFSCFVYSVVTAEIKSSFREADNQMQGRIHTTERPCNALVRTNLQFEENSPVLWTVPHTLGLVALFPGESGPF